MRKMTLTKTRLLYIQLASYLIFIAFLLMNRYDAGVPDFVQGLAFGISATGLVFVVANYKLLQNRAN